MYLLLIKRVYEEIIVSDSDSDVEFLYEVKVSAEEQISKNHARIKEIMVEHDFDNNKTIENAANLVSNLMREFPPKIHLDGEGSNFRRGMIKKIFSYHPDKNQKETFGVVWFKTAEEICKVLNRINSEVE